MGSLFGLAMPLAVLSLSSPLLGWTALGGEQPFSFFWMRPPPRFYRGDGWDRSLLLSEPPCPGEASFRPLKLSPLPKTIQSYDGVVACILVTPDGEILRARIMDSQGRAVRDPRLAASIMSQWRFEAGGDVNAWARIRLDGLMAQEAPLEL